MPLFVNCSNDEAIGLQFASSLYFLAGVFPRRRIVILNLINTRTIFQRFPCIDIETIFNITIHYQQLWLRTRLV